MNIHEIKELVDKHGIQLPEAAQNDIDEFEALIKKGGFGYLLRENITAENVDVQGLIDRLPESMKPLNTIEMPEGVSGAEVPDDDQQGQCDISDDETHVPGITDGTADSFNEEHPGELSFKLDTEETDVPDASDDPEESVEEEDFHSLFDDESEEPAEEEFLSGEVAENDPSERETNGEGFQLLSEHTSTGHDDIDQMFRFRIHLPNAPEGAGVKVFSAEELDDPFVVASPIHNGYCNTGEVILPDHPVVMRIELHTSAGINSEKLADICQFTVNPEDVNPDDNKLFVGKFNYNPDTGEFTNMAKSSSKSNPTPAPQPAPAAQANPTPAPQPAPAAQANPTPAPQPAPAAPRRSSKWWWAVAAILLLAVGAVGAIMAEKHFFSGKSAPTSTSPGAITYSDEGDRTSIGVTEDGSIVFSSKAPKTRVIVNEEPLSYDRFEIHRIQGSYDSLGDVIRRDLDSTVSIIDGRRSSSPTLLFDNPDRPRSPFSGISDMEPVEGEVSIDDAFNLALKNTQSISQLTESVSEIATVVTYGLRRKLHLHYADAPESSVVTIYQLRNRIDGTIETKQVTQFGKGVVSSTTEVMPGPYTYTIYIDGKQVEDGTFEVTTEDFTLEF